MYLVMELVEGKGFRKILAERPTRLRALLDLLVKVSDGVHHAHEHGVVHRDLKPENILIPASGEPKVADFGLAHLVESDLALTRTSARHGTPLYMAPEQVEGRSRDVTPATDVYALGAILYEVLTGSPPFTGDSVANVFSRILSEDPVPPRKCATGIHPDLETIALKALAKEPARRYSSARAFADDLRRHLSDEPIVARPMGVTHRVYRKARKNPVAAMLAAGTAVAVAVAVLVWASFLERTRRADQNRAIALETIRSAARVSLDAALGFRRLGANDRMMQSLPPLEEAYRRAAELAPDMAEVDYLMGRMHRALMQHGKALEYQEQALRKDPAFVPALYERIVLISQRYGGSLRNSYTSLPLPEGADLTAEGTRQFDRRTIDEIEQARPEIARVRNQLFRDCELLERLLRDARVRATLAVPMSEANMLAVRGILATCRDEFAKAKESLLEAVKQDPLLEEAWESLAKGTSDTPAEGGEEREKRWAEAIRLFGEARSRDLGYVPHLLGRADVLHTRGDDRMCRGRDPLPDFASGEQDLSEVLRLMKSSLDAIRARADLRTVRGVYLMSRGQDPLPDFRAAETDYDEALRRAPDADSVLRRRGGLFVRRAEYRMDRHEDPLSELDAAERDLSRALDRRKEESATWGWRGYVRLLRGAHRATIGGDPLPEFAAAEKDLSEAIRRFVAYPLAWSHRGRLRTLRGVYRMTKGEDPADDFRRAEEDLSECIRRAGATTANTGWLTSEFLPGWTDRAILRTHSGRDKMRRGQDPRSDFESAFQDFGEALAFNRYDASAIAARGRLQLLRGKQLDGQGQKAEAAKHYTAAVEDLQKSLEINPLLKAQVGTDLSEAKKKLDRP
jgi:tetratricopeptide (TPR) repeat protein